MAMTVREFINNIATGEFSDSNDILNFSKLFPDIEELIWSLKLADIACLESTGKPQISDDKQISRIKRAIEILSKSSESSASPQKQQQEPLETVHQVNVPADRKPGKPKKKISFTPVINKEHPVTHQPQDPDRILATLHSLIDGKIGKDVAMVIQAAIMTGKITKPQYSQVASEFGDIGHRSGYDKYMAIRFADIEIKGMMRQFESL